MNSREKDSKQAELELTHDEWREELKKQLTLIFEKSPELVRIFAARNALRVFPLLAKAGHFDYWQDSSSKKGDNSEQEATGSDNRAKHLVALWKPLTVGLRGLRSNVGVARTALAARAARAARAADADADYADYAYAYAADAAYADAADAAYADAADAAYADAAYADAVYAAAAYADAAYAAAYAVADADATIKQQINKDLLFLQQVIKHPHTEPSRIAEAIKTFSRMPLWENNAISDVLKKVISHQWPDAIDDLAKAEMNKGNKEIAEILWQLPADYQAILTGTLPQTPPPESGEAGTAEPKILAESVEGDDRLNRGQLTTAIARILLDSDHNQHLALGLFGDWGVGKSSLVKSLRAQLKADNGSVEFVYGEFDAWHYEHTDNIQAGITHEVIKALTNFGAKSSRSQWQWFTLRLAYVWGERKTAFSLLIAVALIFAGLVVIVAGRQLVNEPLQNEPLQNIGTQLSTVVVFLSGFAWLCYRQLKDTLSTFSIKQFLALPKWAEHLGSIPVMRQQIDSLCRLRLGEKGRGKHQKTVRLLFVIENLDRCRPENIVKVFEALHLILEVNQVSLILAVDQRIALAGLALQYKDVATYHHYEDPRRIARDYLGKIIHIPIRLTVPDRESVIGYLASLWKEDTLLSMVGLANKPPSEQSQTNATPASPTVAATFENDDSGADKGYDEDKDYDEDEGKDYDPLSPENLTAIKAFSKQLTETSEVQPATVTSVLGLTKHQKIAFEFWINHFQLANPRQVKRLLNSYNLIRLLYGDEQESTGLNYPHLVALLALEYINSLEQAHLINALRQVVLGQDNKEGHHLAELPAFRLLASAWQKIEGFHQACTEVDNFVLPVLERLESAPP